MAIPINFFLFQAGWFALVLSVAAGLPAAGMVVALALFLAHLRYFAAPGEGMLIVIIGVGGWLWESLLQVLGIVDHGPAFAASLAAPPWMALLWMNFAITLNHSLNWLKGQWLYAVLLGATGGPLAFWAGARLGAITFGNDLTAMVVLCIAWAVLCPLAVVLALVFEGKRQREHRAWN